MDEKTKKELKKKRAISQKEEMLKDTQKEYRQHKNICKSCFYTNKFALQAFSKYKCKNCNESKLHHNSLVPTYCDLCSKEKNICCECGQTMD